MTVALLGPKGPSRSKRFILICNYVLLLGGLAFLIGFHAAASAPLQSPKARLEQMVVGTAIPDSTTTAYPVEVTIEMEAEAVSQLSPADRFRKIIKEEAMQQYGHKADFEPPAALHPIKKSLPRRRRGKGGAAGKIAAAVLPSAALFSQVMMGSRMKDRVLSDRASPMGFDAVDASRSLRFDDEPADKASRGERVKQALTSNAAIGVTAALASVAALYLAKQGWDYWNKDRKVGLLTPKTAKWQLEQCLLIVDILEAEKAGALAGKYVRGSARVLVDLNSQRATLSYSVIPGFTRSPFRSMLRRAEPVFEHFFLPTHSCFVSAGVKEEKSSVRTPLSTSREYVEKGFFGRKRTTALTLRLEKSPGVQLLEQTPESPEPPLGLVEAVRFKHENTGENAVGQEESPSALGMRSAAVDAAPLASLEELMLGGDVCGGTALCVESVFISTEENVCVVSAAVDDMRRISVLAEVSTQTIIIAVEADDDDAATDKTTLQGFAAEYRIALPRNCVLADAELAMFSVSPFSIDVSPPLGSKDDLHFEDFTLNNPTFEQTEEKATTPATPSDEEKAANDDSGGAVSADSTSEGAANEDSEGGAGSGDMTPPVEAVAADLGSSEEGGAATEEGSDDVSSGKDSGGEEVEKEEADDDGVQSASTSGARTEDEEDENIVEDQGGVSGDGQEAINDDGWDGDVSNVGSEKDSSAEKDADGNSVGNGSSDEEANGVHSASANGTRTAEDANTTADVNDGNGSASPGGSAGEENGDGSNANINNGGAADAEEGGADGADKDSSDGQARYQHVSIRFVTLPESEVLVVLKTLPEKLLSSG